MSDLKEIMKELNEINEIIKLRQFLNFLKQMKVELQGCKNSSEKLLVMLRYADIFD